MWLAYLAYRKFASIAFICEGLTMFQKVLLGPYGHK